MPITILKNSSKNFTLPLVDNLGNTYTAKPGSYKVVNDNPELGDITYDQNTGIGVAMSKGTNGVMNYHFSATTIQGKVVSGKDFVVIADSVDKEDANQVVALYQD
jgi:hypothetical protein